MKTSDIIKEYSIHDSMAFNSLSPKMKECAESLFNMLDNEKDSESYDEEIDFCDNIEDCVKKIILKHDIEKEQLLDYIELEVREQLKTEV